MSWGEAFVWTCVLELPFYWGLLRGRLRWWAPPVVTVGLNAATHPLLWWLCVRAPQRIVPCELAVIAVEGTLVWLLLRRASVERAAPLAFAASAAANAFSWLAGPSIVRALR